MESAFGADFGEVRVHTGGESAALNEALGARAFTYGSDIHLGGGVADLSSADGTHLLAHELAHVVQQTGDRVHRLVDRAGLVAKAGAPHGNIGLTQRSTEYKSLLDLLDHYHAESQRAGRRTPRRRSCRTPRTNPRPSSRGVLGVRQRAG
jgi:hypothetical protein